MTGRPETHAGGKYVLTYLTCLRRVWIETHAVGKYVHTYLTCLRRVWIETYAVGKYVLTLLVCVGSGLRLMQLASMYLPYLSA